MANSISFSKCPECEGTIGTRGLARHRKEIHGVTPATTKKVRPLNPAERAVLVEASTGELSPERRSLKMAIKSLTRQGYLTAELTITESGRARIA